MHQALYRKWRPSDFDEVCGQEHISSVLKYQCAEGKTSHAYLFCGSRGTGKTSCAKILAKALNCTESKDGNPCGKCEACRTIDLGIATDVLEMDAASNNGVDNIRDIRDEVSYTPAALKYRVYIVDEVHMLSPAAFNALLKTLEEPPAHVVFILATTELHKLPATIISRCQRFDFRRIGTPAIAERLAKISASEGFDLDADAATLIAKISQGGMRDAISLLELCSGNGERITVDSVNEAIGSTGRDSIVKCVRAIAQKDHETIFSEIAGIVASSKDLTVFWQELINFYRDLFVYKSTDSAKKYLDLTQIELEQLDELSAMFKKETLLYHSKLLDDSFYTIQKQSALKRSAAELTLIRMCDEKLDSSYEALMSRIAALEDKIAFGNYPAQENENSIKTAPVAKTDEPVKKEETKVSALPAVAKNEPKTANPTPLPYWREAVDKMIRSDVSLSGFMTDARGLKNPDGSITIRFTNFIAHSVLQSKKNALRALISSYEGREIPDAALILELASADKKKESSLDEIMDNLN